MKPRAALIAACAGLMVALPACTSSSGSVLSAAGLAGRPGTQAQLVANLAVRLTGQQLQPGFITTVHQSIGSAPTASAMR